MSTGGPKYGEAQFQLTGTNGTRELEIISYGLKSTVAKAYDQYGTSIQVNERAQSNSNLQSSSRPMQEKNAHRSMVKPRPATPTSNKFRTTDHRSKALRPRTPPTYLSKRAPASSTSARSTQHQSLKRKPSVIQNFMAGEPVPSDRLHYTPDTSAANLVPTSPGPIATREAQNGRPSFDMDGVWRIHNPSALNHSTKSLIGHDYRVIASPALSAEQSSTRSPVWTQSPFSHTSTLSSQTSYSSLYDSSRKPRSEVFASPSCGTTGLPRREHDGVYPVTRKPEKAAASTTEHPTPPGRLVQDGITVAPQRFLANTSQEDRRAHSHVKCASQYQGASNPSTENPVSVELPAFTAPPELAHLLVDKYDFATKDAAQSAPKTVKCQVQLPQFESLPGTTPGTLTNLQGYSGESLPPNTRKEAVQQGSSERQILSSNAHSGRPSIDSRLSPSNGQSHIPTLTTNASLVPATETTVGKSRSSLGFWKRDKYAAEGARTLAGQNRSQEFAGVSTTSTTNNDVVIRNRHNGLTHNQQTIQSPTRALRRASQVGKPVVNPSIDEFLSNRQQPVYLKTIENKTSQSEGSPISTSRTSHTAVAQVIHDPVQTPSPFASRFSIDRPSGNAMVEPATSTQPRDNLAYPNHTPARTNPPNSGLALTASAFVSPQPANNKSDTTTARRSAWSLFGKQKNEQKSNSSKGFFRRALSAAPKNTEVLATAPVMNTKLQHEPPASLGNADETYLNQPRATAALPMKDQHETDQRGRSRHSHSTNQLSSSNAQPRDPVRAEAAPRRSSSIIRTSFDAISRSRNLMRRDPAHRAPRMSQDSQLAPDSRVRAYQPVVSPRQVSSSLALATAPPSKALPRKAKVSELDSLPVAETKAEQVLPVAAISENFAVSPAPEKGKPTQFQIAKAEEKHHLSQVVEEGFLAFSVNRNSTSSHRSSGSATFYFPLAPSRPPTTSLPRIPDDAKYSSEKLSGVPSSPLPTPPTLASPIPESTASVFAPRTIRSDRPSMISNNSEITSTNLPTSGAGSRQLDMSNRTGPSSNESVAQPGAVLPQKRASGLLSSRWTVTTTALDNDAYSMTDLRFASLMTSKWLSFGRVLFSPAHIELKAYEHNRVLVIDGLGSDWSYYCAMTYPHVQVHMLATRAAVQDKTDISGLQAPSNFHEDLRSNIASKFPYPNNSFAATVVRFPLATTDPALRLIIAECTRVLRPGGYIETSAIDLDLANMGSHGRRSVRELKMRLQQGKPQTCLKPVSDNIQTLLGRCGYEKLSRCIIGVPAAGPVANSWPASCDKQIHSFDDLIKDDSEKGDKGIVNMVSKVGRYWYHQCYEQVEGANSIWNDRMLLKECEELRTAFKLLVCYAQKPAVPTEKAS